MVAELVENWTRVLDNTLKVENNNSHISSLPIHVVVIDTLDSMHRNVLLTGEGGIFAIRGRGATPP